jgi:hypothetical protein
LRIAAGVVSTSPTPSQTPAALIPAKDEAGIAVRQLGLCP